MAFFTSLFRNLKEGGEVKSQFWQLFEKASKPLPTPLYRKEGGVVSGPFPPKVMEALAQSFRHIPRGPPQPIRRKKGGRIPKKSPGSKNNKKQPGSKNQTGFNKAGKK